MKTPDGRPMIDVIKLHADSKAYHREMLQSLDNITDPNFRREVAKLVDEYGRNSDEFLDVVKREVESIKQNVAEANAMNEESLAQIRQLQQAAKEAPPAPETPEIAVDSNFPRRVRDSLLAWYGTEAPATVAPNRSDIFAFEDWARTSMVGGPISTATTNDDAETTPQPPAANTVAPLFSQMTRRTSSSHVWMSDNAVNGSSIIYTNNSATDESNGNRGASEPAPPIDHAPAFDPTRSATWSVWFHRADGPTPGTPTGDQTGYEQTKDSGTWDDFLG
ncbi:hypothetical protein Pan216_17550 [Planctomycetes bacterium Pan216]|uniref:Uncharacterized protein n=1 Tax=Kolteria novifilia TaxID=2527975 RepID=A0A518B1S9_9BACT|nr:hypothetical protein Pan216_17550 [Planctomycetes bacterium Pan216]